MNDGLLGMIFFTEFTSCVKETIKVSDGVVVHSLLIVVADFFVFYLLLAIKATGITTTWRHIAPPFKVTALGTFTPSKHNIYSKFPANQSAIARTC